MLACDTCGKKIEEGDREPFILGLTTNGFSFHKSCVAELKEKLSKMLKDQSKEQDKLVNSFVKDYQYVR